MKKVIPFLICCLILFGCGISEPSPTDPSVQSAPTQTPTQIPEDTTEPSATEAPMLVFTLCHGDENADGFIFEEVYVSEITFQTVLDKVIEADVLPGLVVINSFSAEGAQLNIDFNSAFYDYLCTMGTSGERMLIGGVVNTFLNAFQAEAVYLTVDGEIIESGHVIYDFPLEFIS